jgi:hypothetical protein
MILSAVIRNVVKRQLTRRGYAFWRLDELTLLANRVGSDKGTEHGGHFYTRVYRDLFNSLRHKVITLLEMGLLRPAVNGRRLRGAFEGISHAIGRSAPSLEMWRSYFPNAKIYGFDVDDFSTVRIDGCTIIQGDMSCRKDLLELAHKVGCPLDVVIDDASHISHHQQVALGTLFPYVSSGGMYIIEDLHWQDPILEIEGAIKTRDLLRRLQLSGRVSSPFMTKNEVEYIEDNVNFVQLFDSLSEGWSDPTDALGLIVKNDHKTRLEAG